VFGEWFFDNLVMKEGKRRRRWPCDLRRELEVLRSYAGTLIFQQGSIGFGWLLAGLI
jgi:hypothetical protein